MLTDDEKIDCLTEDFLDYTDDPSEKIVTLRNIENHNRGVIVRPCDSSRYFEGGQRTNLQPPSDYSV